MMMMQIQREGGGDDQKDSPSFRMDSPERISASAAAACTDPENDSDGDGEDGDDDFEFSFRQIPASGPPIAADEIFSNGKILPVYSLFNRDLLIDSGNDSADFAAPAVNYIQNQGKEEPISSSRVPLRRLFVEEEREQASFSSSSSSSTSSSSSSLDELDAIPPGTYCVWNPNGNKDRCKKSSSTGSTPSSLRWKLKDLIVGRSRSDGKQKFVFIPVEKAAEIQRDGQMKAKKGEENKDNRRGKKLGISNYSHEDDSKNRSSSAEVDVATAQKRMMMMYYGQNGQVEVRRYSGRKSFLPYKRNLVGFFARNDVNGPDPRQDPF